jgi:hypothetical protein
VRVGSLIRRHHHAFIPRQPLNLLLHIAPLVCAPVVTPVCNTKLVYTSLSARESKRSGDWILIYELT